MSISLSLNKTDNLFNIFDEIIKQRMYIPNANKGHEKLGCIVFTNHKRSCFLYPTGHNQYSVGKFNGTFYESIHAEIDAMNKLKYNYSKKTKKINLFVFRVNNYGETKYAKCCDNCKTNIYKIAQIKGYNIKHIYYTTNYNNIDIL